MYLNRGVGILTRDEVCQVPGEISTPEDDISLSYMDRLMMDCFSPTFRSFFLLEHKMFIKHENFNFLLIGFTLNLS